MKPETYYKIKEMDVLKANTFDTMRGKYRISILLDKHNDIYFCKSIDGELVELVNMSEEARKLQALTIKKG